MTFNQFVCLAFTTDAEHKSGQDVRSNVFQIFSMTRHGIESGLPALVALVQSTAEISRFCVKQCYANICQNFKQIFRVFFDALTLRYTWKH